jgi:hypothetical protein
MPGNLNPFAGLLKGRRKRSGGTLVGAAKEAWLLVRVCAAARDAALESEDMEVLHRFVGLEAQILKIYASLMLPSQIEERLQAVESRRPKADDEPSQADPRWDYKDLLD